jgi:excisionase family DNA binding protein
VANFSPALPSESESALAKETSRILASQIAESGPLEFRLMGNSGETVGLPAAAVRVLMRVLEEMAQGNAITIIPVHAELTTQEAADLLDISRPSLIQLLDEGKIDFRKVGTHRRVRFQSLLAYKRKADADRRAALAELAAYDQELGL